jgi:hypothetical protein
LRLEFFRRVTTPRTHAEAKELAEALYSWEAFGEVLRRAYGNPSRCRNRRIFDRRVVSVRTHRVTTKAFQEFERRFARLPERGRRLVGADEVRFD